MRRHPAKARLVGGAVITLVLIGVASCRGELAALGANGLLHPSRRVVDIAPPADYKSVSFVGGDVTLAGWLVTARTLPRRANIIYLHGVADSRGSSIPVIERFVNRGFDVVAYDSRAHGDSSGDACTYGFYEKRDLSRVVDELGSGPVVVIGSSLGAAVALQAAAEDSRITAVVAAESFADLRTVATERAPWFFDRGVVSRAFVIAEGLGSFRVDAVSPAAAARRIKAPVFVIHGTDDVETSAEHSRRIFAALGGERRLRLVAGAGHNRSLTPAVWLEIDSWIDSVLGKR